MAQLGGIDVRVESPGVLPESHGNVVPLLHEILHALNELQRQGRSTTIDLRSIPFAPGDQQRLLDTLGKGEVEASLDSLGSSTIYESSFVGVWVVEHKNASGEVIALQVEITTIPEILKSQAMDISDSLIRLSEQLSAPAEEEGQKA